MNKVMKILFSLSLLLLSIQTVFSSDIFTIEIEQVVLDAPQGLMIVRYKDMNDNCLNILTEEITPTLNIEDKKINVNSFGLENIIIKEHYYIFIDNSSSMDIKFIEETKKSIIEWESNNSENISLTVISFDEDIEIVYDDKSENLEASLEKIKNDGEITKLYEAIYKYQDLANSNAEEGFVRNIAIVVSDGSNYESSGITKDEILDSFNNKKLPVYSLIKGNDKKSIQNLTEISRKTNAISVLNNEKSVKDDFMNLINYIENYHIIPFTLGNSHLSSEIQKLNLTIKIDDKKLITSTNFTVDSVKQDILKPVISEVVYDDKVILMDLKNDLIDINETDLFRIKNDDYTAIISSVISIDNRKVEITLQEPLKPGSYQIEYYNPWIIDSDKYEYIDNSEINVTENYMSIYIVIGTVVLTTLMFGVLVFKKRKKAKVIKLGIINKHGKKVVKDMRISNQIIIGRGSNCDISLPDNNMSKKHCRLFVCKNKLYLEDLNSTNGTKLNGESINVDTVIINHSDVIEITDYLIEVSVIK